MKGNMSNIEKANYCIENAKNIQDYCDAYKFSILALKQGVTEAHYLLGQLYLYGTGCSKNLHKAKKHFSSFILKCNEDDDSKIDSLTDAYFKLAETEKKLRHYQNAHLCYQKLIKLNPQYRNFADDLKKEISDSRKESVTSCAFIGVSVIAICACVFIFGNMFNRIKYDFGDKYVVEPKVIREERTPTAMQPPEKMDIQKDITYNIVSEKEFNSLNLKKIEIVDATSTSEYISKKGNYYGSKNLIDEKINSVWQEGENDAGAGQQICFILKDCAIISGMKLINGKQSSINDYFANNRLASFSMFGDENVLVEVQDLFGPQYIIFNNPINVDKVELVIKSVFSGTQYNDTCITDISFYE